MFQGKKFIIQLRYFSQPGVQSHQRAGIQKWRRVCRSGHQTPRGFPITASPVAVATSRLIAAHQTIPHSATILHPSPNSASSVPPSRISCWLTSFLEGLTGVYWMGYPPLSPPVVLRARSAHNGDHLNPSPSRSPPALVSTARQQR